jgi:DNA-binding response OmpR family regulator
MDEAEAFRDFLASRRQKDELKGLQMGASAKITKPLSPAVVRAGATIAKHQDRLEAMVAEKTAGLVEPTRPEGPPSTAGQDKEEAEM